MKAEAQDALGYCGGIEDNVDYSAYNLYNVHNITSVADCCARCQQDPECRAWTWGKARRVCGLSDVCYLKGLVPGEAVSRMPNGNTTSGLPFRMGRPGGASLFCFSPVLADDGVASRLLVLQHSRGAGIFGCEEYAIYSTQPLRLIPEVKCSIVRDWRNCSAGGNASCGGSSAHTEVWRQVVAEGRFRFHDWTAKVEPSAVFLPDRLRSVLSGLREPGSGAYLDGCQGGLRTPLAVLSRGAVQVFALGYARCLEGRGGAAPGDRRAGDALVDRCLSRVLRVERHTTTTLLSDPSCQTHDFTCSSGYVAFYPFSQEEDYDNCLKASGWKPPVRAIVSGALVSDAPPSDASAEEGSKSGGGRTED